MSSRNIPFHRKDSDWNTILTGNICIPMNQRQFEWKKENIIVFHRDMVSVFEEGKDVEWMGTIIQVRNGNQRDTWDGQQRTLVTALTLISIYKQYPQLETLLENILFANKLVKNTMSPQQKLLMDKGVRKIPRICAVNPWDNEALIKIANNEYECFTKWMDDSTCMDDDLLDDEVEVCRCKECKTSFTRLEHLRRHLLKSHGYTSIDTSTKKSNIYTAYDCIYRNIQSLKYDDDKMTEFVQFILTDIFISLCECTDVTYVSKIFEWENNRGQRVVLLDIVKNNLLTIMPDDKKEECYDEWCNLFSVSNEQYKDFGKKIGHCAIQCLNQCFDKDKTEVDLYRIIIETGDPYSEWKKFCNTCKRLHCIYDAIKADRYGRLMTTNNRVYVKFEGIHYLLLPIFYKLGYDKRIVKLIVKWLMRNIAIPNTDGFDKLGYSVPFIKLANDVMQGDVTDIQQCLQRIQGIFIQRADHRVKSPETFVQCISETPIKQHVATYLLQFIETCECTDNVYPPLNNTLEHIVPQKQREHLPVHERTNIDKLGNLTLLEGANSENGHKGNSSLKDKPYATKRKQYGSSSIRITNELAKQYEDFSEEFIMKRTEDLARLLEKHTNYFI